ncbi:ABC transporter permease [Roseivivax sediminis]|uniref:Putative spermidine/putrescine transport system permease protein n=1 Tax=Roseivivax sediminis TaxID=936889 RepID=A0A1I1VBE3_9RHOB|nr:ABC transporter permease [Roseivivax sediminis]SFD78433.1 putative spermidine/putrescine transport system permease protein [Roseivivax sediminis]
MKTILSLMSLPVIAVLVLGAAPLCVVVVWSFWTWDPSTYWIRPELSLAGYAAIGEAGRWTVLLGTLFKAVLAASFCVVLAFPLAYAIRFLAGRRLALVLMALITIPFFTSYLIRAFSWRLVLGRTGPVNEALQSLGLIAEPLDWLLFSDFAIMVGFIASYLPFAAFPLILAMQRVEPSLLKAAQDLGAGFWRIVGSIVIPLTLSGSFAGFLFVFVMVIGSQTEVQMLGGAGAPIVSIMINDVMRVANFPLAFAISSVVLICVFGVLLAGNRIFGLARLFEGMSK